LTSARLDELYRRCEALQLGGAARLEVDTFQLAGKSRRSPRD
jgi:hypothetical protein